MLKVRTTFGILTRTINLLDGILLLLEVSMVSVVYLSCCSALTTTRQILVLACFVSAVNEYGLPSRIRTDKGLENVGIAQFMIQNRGTNRGSVIAGKRTHKLHLSALHYIFVPPTNEKLTVWKTAWAHHRMRTTRSTPAQLWLTGQVNNPVGFEATLISVEDPDGDLDEGNEEQLHGNRPVFLPLLSRLFEACHNELNAQTWTRTNHGIDDFIKALGIIRRHDV